LRVCFVSSYPPNRARLSEYAKNLVKELANRPKINKIYVLADVAEKSKSHIKENRKIEVLRCWKPDNPFSIFSIIFHILKLKPDIVHFNIHFQSYGRSRIANFIGLSLPFFSRIFAIPSIVTIHNLGEMVNLKVLGIKQSFLNRIGIKLATKLITLAKVITVTTQSYINFLKNVYKCKNVVFVPHGTSVFNIQNSASTNFYKNILMFGHMSPYKGLPLMLKIFDKLIKQNNDFKLIIAGDSHPNFPNYLDEFKRNLNPNIEFIGYVPEDALPKLFQNIFVVVLPYLTGTGTSGVFHLACGFGKPIIASDLPEIRELVKEGASALLIPPNDIDGFCKAILHLSNNPKLVEEMGKKNILFASKESWNIVAESFECIYIKLKMN